MRNEEGQLTFLTEGSSNAKKASHFEVSSWFCILQEADA